MNEEPIWEGFVCSVCGLGFDAESWDMRHTDPDDALAEVHERCCRACSGAAHNGSQRTMKVAYWCNLNLRDKYFGYKETDDLMYVGIVEAADLNDAYRQFNRIDEPTPIIDEAEAPSMSIGDVAQVYGDPTTTATGEAGDWFVVASIGFDQISEPNSDRLLYPVGEKVGDVIGRTVDQINRNREIE